MLKSRYLVISIILVITVALTGLSFDVFALPIVQATAPKLKDADSYAVLGGSTVTNTGTSNIYGDLGVSPGSAVTGFPPGIVVPPGTIHKADAHAASAQISVTTAYNNLKNQPCDFDMTGVDLGGKTLTPGIYCFSTSAQLTGKLTLDAQGDPFAVWVFQMGSTLKTASGSSVVFINYKDGSGAEPGCNLFWQVGSSATIGTTTEFAGNILALQSITMTNSANLDGRALARNGAVTLDTNNIKPVVCTNTLTKTPTKIPTKTLTKTPTKTLTKTPTKIPTNSPTNSPTKIPTISPTKTPILPDTGFAPKHVTILSAQSAERDYAELGDLWLEIPSLDVQMPIVGVPQVDGSWDVSWLGNDAGWLNGTAFPTWEGNSVLTGHVYDSNGNPGPFIHLNWLWWGNKVVVHAWGVQYIYEVRQMMQVYPGDTSSVIKHEELPWVTLITCRGYNEDSGSYKYRVVVRAVLVEIKE